MKSTIPFILPFSHTPRFARKVTPKLHLIPGRSIRNISAGPLTSKSSFYSSSDSMLSSRVVSDEVKLSPIKDPFITSSKPLEKPRPSRSYSKDIYCKKQCSTVISAIFTLFSCEKRVQADDLISLFISLNLTNSKDLLFEIFKGISAGLSPNIISYSKQDLLKICEDRKTQKILKKLQKESEKNLDSLVSTVQKWWKKLDKDQKGSVPFNALASYLTEIEAVESSSDLKRLFLIVNESGKFIHFFAFFCKSLLLFLISEVFLLIGDENKFLSPEISILEVRRKLLLNNLENTGKIFRPVCSFRSFNY